MCQFTWLPFLVYEVKLEGCFLWEVNSCLAIGHRDFDNYRCYMDSFDCARADDEAEVDLEDEDEEDYESLSELDKVVLLIEQEEEEEENEEEDEDINEVEEI